MEAPQLGTKSKVAVSVEPKMEVSQAMRVASEQSSLLVGGGAQVAVSVKLPV